MYGALYKQNSAMRLTIKNKNKNYYDVDDDNDNNNILKRHKVVTSDALAVVELVS